MILATYATHSSNYFDVLKDSARFHGYKLVVLGMGNEWKGLMDKFLYMVDFLNDLPEEEVVAFVDAFDTIVLRPDCQEVFDHIHEDGKVLFSACHSDWVMDFLFGCAHPHDHQKHYNSINTGLYIGYVRDLRHLFEKFQPYMIEESNDQRAMNHYYREVGEHIQLDSGCQMFYNVEWQMPVCLRYFYWMFGIPYHTPLVCEHYQMEQDKHLTVVKTNTQPYFVQGNMNVNMDEIVRHLGWHTRKTLGTTWHYYWCNTFTYISYAFWKIWRVAGVFHEKQISSPPSQVPKDMMFKVDSRSGQFIP